MPDVVAASQDPRQRLPRTRSRRLLGVAALVAPIVAWLISLGASYVIQDFTCSAYTSTGRMPPGSAVFWIVVALNACMLAICVAAVIAGAVLLVRREREQDESGGAFLGVAAIGAGLFFGYGVVMIGATPFLFGGCG
ncbi:hypothetical protein M4I32_10655 [Microbacterium sp. LRZ72]|uniref:hypothetical protein n=1 Tax=Microbacterium sp. LRZ72 TaxID=2942481 RepID=UPI0029BEB911|nr:hypothetical protein [Microbacterium sp. LRZ72]MDX2377259.1 hypothetical protein [Microbacterium sp. LRZ72]